MKTKQGLNYSNFDDWRHVYSFLYSKVVADMDFWEFLDFNSRLGR